MLISSMYSRFCLVLILTALPNVTRAAEAHTAVSPRNALEERLLADAADGDLDELTLVEAALIAAGIADEKEVASYVARYQTLLVDLDGQCAALPAEARVRTAFRVLHQRILTGAYDAHCSSLRTTLDDGRFNCVSATILFHAMCVHVGLQPQTVSTPDHVFSQLDLAGIGDIQTTCANWLDSPRAVERTGHSPADDVVSRRLLTPVQLLGKVYYNTGVELLQSGDFAAAVAALQVSVRLDKDDCVARDNLLAGWNNWSLAEEDAGRLPRAAELVERGLRWEPSYAPLLANDLHIHQRWALQLCDDGRYEQALQLLQRCHARRPEARLFDLGRVAVVALWSESLFRLGQFEEAFRVFDDAQRMLAGSAGWDECEEALICRSVASLMRKGSRAQALQLCTRGIERLPESARLLRQHRDLTQ
jgi:tetratricopeptide (TPR) repeat protein